MTRLFKTLAAGSMAALAFSTAVPALALDDQQKKEMGEFIREYLTQNPEVLIEAQNALEAKQQAQRVAQSTQAIEGNKTEIFSSPADITLGNPKGDVTIVEFFDYNCGYCKRALSDMDEILAKDKNIRFILKEFPILGPDSLAAHRVANAIRLLAPHKYAEFHRALLGEQAHASEETAIAVATSLGIDEAAIRKSMVENPNDDLVRQAYQLANSIGITGTPTYIVGNEAVFGAVGLDVIEAKVANVRACGKATC
ncbi:MULTISPECIES: DsbA family protein [Rhizobium/Agrobacterium group]|uniref:DsbA family protein n=2 Tax=Neorhizobium TaxID=1525371 RepID=A0ABV0M2T9_9HYPH|nr:MULTISPECIES: DsbA family protein [Rhizobium/Agrobacterium group]KGD99514.1 DSBA oxidoreductase [Rhizobium sp. YS-1r]MCC2609574.1 DsbA family protein [Neorhizobium petrolearium]WGI69776.1 DsbA family protein [Neorhizobium petrolearium]